MPGGSGIPTSAFNDINLITGPAVLNSRDDFPNEAQERSYLTGFFLTNALDLQGGKRPEMFVMKDDGSTATNNLPSAMRSVSDPQVMAQLVTEWRLTEDVMAPNVIMRALNEGGGGSMEARYHQMMSEKKKEEQRLATSYCNKFEADWFAQPNATTQQGTSGATDPDPFWMYVNEYGADGLIFDSTDASFPSQTGLPAGVTTICGRDPVVDKWYRAWQIPYSGTVDTSTVNPGGHLLIQAFKKACNLVQYGPLPWRKEHSDQNTAKYNPDYVVPVSINGDALIHTLAASNSNFFRSAPNDPYFPNLSFAGIPFLPCSWMDKAKVYPTSGTTAPAVGAGATETTAANGGPRFPFLSRRQIKWVMHSTYNFYMWEPRSPSRQWDVEISPVSTLHNRICRSRRKLAIVYPSDDIVGFGGNGD